MPDNSQSALALRAFREVQIEMGQDPAPGQTLFPALDETLDRLVSMPADALMLGIASDGLPLLLHLRDPRPGPILLTGDRGCGKTDFLKVFLQAAQRFCRVSEASFAVLTETPSDFDHIGESEHLLGVWPAYEMISADLLSELASRAQHPDIQHPIVLLIDGLESVLQMEPEAQDNLAYILSCGPQKLVWPVVTINSGLALKLPQWLAYFRTRIYGRIANPGTIESLTPVPGAPLNRLFPGSQFCLRQKSKWLKFWMPSLPI